MKLSKTLLVLVAASTLGGCQSFAKVFGFSGHATEKAPVFGQADLEEGREALRAGHIGNAIAPLQRAALNPQTAPEALNALGVAYAKLQRADLAERYFRAAVRMDGTNERFAANLDRFYRSDLAASRRAVFAREQEAAERLAQMQKEAELAASLPDERSIMSQGEVRRITIEGRPSPRGSRGASQLNIRTADAATGADRHARLPSDRPTEIRITTKAKTSSAPQSARLDASIYPLRVTLPKQEAKPRVTVGAGGSYPLRVRLPAKADAKQ